MLLSVLLLISLHVEPIRNQSLLVLIGINTYVLLEVPVKEEDSELGSVATTKMKVWSPNFNIRQANQTEK